MQQDKTPVNSWIFRLSEAVKQVALRYPVAQWLTVAWVGVLVATLPIKYMHADDGWLLDYTYYLSQLGYVRSDIMGDYHGYKEQLLVFHKGWLGQGALLARWLGHTIVPLKGLSALYAVSALAVLYRLGRVYGLPAALAWVPMALVILHPHFFDHAALYRPEAAVAFAGLVSVLALTRYLQTGLLWWAVGAGAAAGLAALFHLNGLCIIVATVGALAFERRWLHAIIAGVTAAAVLALYTADMWWPGSIPLFLDQLQHDPAVTPGKKWYMRLLQLASEYKRYFKSWRESGFSLAVVAMLLVAGGLLWRQARHLMVWLGLGMLALSLLAREPVPYYSIYFLPLLALLWAMAWYQLRPQARWQQVGLAIALIAMGFHILAGTASSGYMLAGSRAAETRHDMERALAIVGEEQMVGPPEMVCIRKPDPKFRIFQAYGGRQPVIGSYRYWLEKAPADGFRWALIETDPRRNIMPDTSAWHRVFRGPRFTLWRAR